MKWARPELPKKPLLVVTPHPSRKKFIRVMKINSVKDLYNAGFTEWLICKEKKDWEVIQRFTADDRFSYEAFIGGFLAYFELHISKPKTDRTVYFDWYTLNPAVPLTIYLTGVEGKYYENGKLLKKLNIPGKAGWTSAPEKSSRSPLAPPPAVTQTDPPVPPVPPPPPPRFSDQT